jgi:hypothetical protein
LVDLTLIGQTALATIAQSQETGFIVWSPYAGETALLLALFLFALCAAIVLLGKHLKRDVRLPSPRRWLKAVIAVIWVLQILILLKAFKDISAVDPSAGVTGPVLPVTLASAACTFIIVRYLLRRDGTVAAFGGAFIATVAGPMVFEFPFVLIVAPVASVPTDPGAALTIPFFVAMITTLALLSFTTRAAITRYSLYFLGAMFLTFGVWALFGFSYPSDPVSFLLNCVSKVLGFATTAAMFKRDNGPSDPSGLIPAVSPLSHIARSESIMMGACEID